MVTSTAEITDTSGKYGDGINCPSGYCCSKYGWCGQTDDYCALSKGCQSKYGDCFKDIDTTLTHASTIISTTISTTITTTFTATVTANNVSTTILKEEGRCGEDFGNCPSGQCCSKYGWCSNTGDHCSISRGCKSEFGQCTMDIDSTSMITTPNEEGRCGEGYGSCSSGYCCSKYSWCGSSSEHCGTGWQSEFGKWQLIS